MRNEHAANRQAIHSSFLISLFLYLILLQMP